MYSSHFKSFFLKFSWWLKQTGGGWQLKSGWVDHIIFLPQNAVVQSFRC